VYRACEVNAGGANEAEGIELSQELGGAPTKQTWFFTEFAGGERVFGT
jgi:hypothetical protein